MRLWNRIEKALGVDAREGRRPKVIALNAIDCAAALAMLEAALMRHLTQQHGFVLDEMWDMGSELEEGDLDPYSEGEKT